MNDRMEQERLIRYTADTEAPYEAESGGAMPLDSGDVTATVTPADDDPEVAELRVEIEQTRAELSETIEAIQDRLNPQHIVENAKEAAREATIGKVEHFVSNVTETARDLVGGSRPAAATYGSYNTPRRGGGTMMETIRQNPLPTALAAFGLGWLWTHRAQGGHSGTTLRYDSAYQSRVSRPDYGGTSDGTMSRSDDMSGQWMGQVQDTAGQWAGRAQDTMGHVTGQAQQTIGQAQQTIGQVTGQAQQAVGQLAGQAQQTAQSLVTGTQQAQGELQRMAQENPLALGAIGLALGAAVGLLLPETELESQMMGGARDALMEKAQETAQSTLQKVQSVAQEAGQAAQSAAQNAAQQQGLAVSQ